MPSISDLRKTRLKKLEAMRKAGVNPYPITTKRTHTIREALFRFGELSRAKTKIVLAGRIRSIREHGGATFFHFEDGQGSVQALLKTDALGKKKYTFFLAHFDIGDVIEVTGTLFVTKRGENTIEVSAYRMLAKSLLPLPEKWHGLKDVEERFRKRYLDLMMNEKVREQFIMRSKILETSRNLLDQEGFMEVETPILQPIPGGAAAKPFKTHLNALHMDLYLRVAPELYLKRLLVGGFERVYEIGRCFRNEGMDKHHNPDFTSLELYWAYQNRDGLMKFIEKLTIELVKKVKGGDTIVYQGKKIHFRSPWQKRSYRDLLRQYANIDIEKTSIALLSKKLKTLGIRAEKNWPIYEYLDALYKKVCQPKLVQPTFIIDHPVEMAVLAKAKEKDPQYADRFQVVAAGIELMNGFSELNDPLEQAKRFELNKLALERRDTDFLEALEYGMPPAAGFAIGMDRFVAMLTDSHSLREAILFPIMRPKSR